MAIIRVTQQDHACNSVQKTTQLIGYVGTTPRATLQVTIDFTNQTIYLFASQIEYIQNEEDLYNLKDCLIRYALHLAYETHCQYVAIVPIESTRIIPDIEQVLKQPEDLFVLFDSYHPSMCFNWKIEHTIENLPIPHLEEYIRVPHGELFAESAKGTYRVLKGSAEITGHDYASFSPFIPRAVVHSGQHIVNAPMIAHHITDLAKISSFNALKTQSEIQIPYAVSFYNVFILSYIIHALSDLGWIKYIQQQTHTTLSLKQTIAALDIKKPQLFYEMLRFLELAHFLQFDSNKEYYICQPDFLKNIEKDLGYLQFLIYGYDHVLKELAPLAKGEKKYGKDIRKNMGLKLFNYFYSSYKIDIEPYLLKIIDTIAPQHVAHIACGSAVRLIQLCQAYPHLKATGLDYDAGACEVARKNVEAAGLSHRITIIQADVFEWAQTKHEEIDLILLVEGIFHDFHHMKDGAKPLLTLLRGSISPHGHLLVEDQNVSMKEENHFPLSIADGFEFLHTVMNATMFTRDQYVELFKSAGWAIASVHGTDLAQDWMYVLKNQKTEKDILVEAAKSNQTTDDLKALREQASPLATIIADVISKQDDGSADRYLLRTDPIYIKAKDLQKKYLDENLNKKLSEQLQQLIIGEQKATTLIVVGMESYVLSMAIEDLIRRGYNCGQLHIVIIDPLQKEIDLELEMLKNIEQKYQVKLGQIISFSKSVENLNPAEWQRIGSLAKNHLIFANLSLHFIGQEATRDQVFKQFNQLGHVRIWIRERELNLLHTKNLSEKVSLAWDYFSPRYKQIEQLGCSSQDKEVLYTWYSLQVKDALNDQETVACTHYCESGKKWLERLNQAGFTSIELEAVAEPSFIDQDGRKAQGKNQAAFFTLIQCKNY